jgi:hypothetical protein
VLWTGETNERRGGGWASGRLLWFDDLLSGATAAGLTLVGGLALSDVGVAGLASQPRQAPLPAGGIAMMVLVLDFPGVTSQQYDELCRRLNGGMPLQTIDDFHRIGYEIVAHVTGPTPDGWRVIDVWPSDEAHERFREDHMPLFEELGIPGATHQSMPVHHLVTE